MLSVIVPTLNEEKYIENTLKALRSQDYKSEYEIIVADSNSKDRTVEIAKKYADKTIVIKERGISKGRNAGAAAARGDIFLFVDADTMLLFNGLTEIEKVLRKKNVVGVSCPIAPLSAQARDFIFYWIVNQLSKTSSKTKKAQVPGICFACRKDAFEKVGGYDESVETAEDYDLSERLSKIGKIEFTEKTLAFTSTRRFDRLGRFKHVEKSLEMYFNYLLTGKGISVKKYKPVR